MAIVMSPSTLRAGLDPGCGEKNQDDRTDSRGRCPPQFDEPEAGSLIATIRSHPRARLYVKPLWWIGTHLRALGCEFVERVPTLNEWTRRPELKITADGCAVVTVPREVVEEVSGFGDALSAAQSATARASVISGFLAASLTGPR